MDALRHSRIINQGHHHWCRGYPSQSLHFEPIKSAFRDIATRPSLQGFALHDVAEYDLQRDIKTYLRLALSDIAKTHNYSHLDSGAHNYVFGK